MPVVYKQLLEQEKTISKARRSNFFMSFGLT